MTAMNIGLLWAVSLAVLREAVRTARRLDLAQQASSPEFLDPTAAFGREERVASYLKAGERFGAAVAGI